MIDKQNRDVVVAVRLNFKDGFTDVNKIASAYGKNNANKFIKDQIDNGRLLYLDNEKATEWLHSRGLQLPKENTISDFSNSTIPQENSAVNNYVIQENTDSNISKNAQEYFNDSCDEYLNSIKELIYNKYNGMIKNTIGENDANDL